MSEPQLRLLSALDEVSAADWDALHEGRHPFIGHAFLAGLERHGCLRARWGWTPRHLTLWRGGRLVAAAPGYVKTNSHGEFVFDHAWAHAYAQYGRDYFPKWLCAVPYSPVAGPRLLARSDHDRRALVDAMSRLSASEGMSSVHVNFHLEQEDTCFDAAVDEPPQPDRPGWLRRLDVQYHWRNREGWSGFDDFLAAMDHKHRKNIRQERTKVARAGVRFRIVHGDEASDDDLMAMHGFYLQTFGDYGNSPALTPGFFRHLATAMPRALVLLLAEHAGAPIAGALCLRSDDTLYGRYWGANVQLPGLHFETCYYQGIDYCLREGLQCFEPGAQGEHKIARGFLPALVRSRHWIEDPAFAAALQAWCEEEAAGVQRYASQLSSRTPFRTREEPDG
ncbi:MAG: GNAT family N-acetyltransferase [Luteimonas sp.]